MGKATDNKGYAHCQFFFELIHDIRSDFPIVFEGGGSNKPHSKEHRDFAQKWGIIGTVYQIAEKKIEKVEKINASYVNDFFQMLSYIIEEQQADEAEDKFQETLRRAKKGGR